MSKKLCRKARRDESELIAGFQVAMAKESENLILDPATCRKGVQHIFDVPTFGQYYICEIDGKVHGCLLIQYEWSEWRNGVVWWLHSLYVEPQMRKQGVFQMLYDHVKKLASNDLGVRGIRLYVDKTNFQAQEVYKKIGMSAEHYSLYEWMK